MIVGIVVKFFGSFTWKVQIQDFFG